MKTLKILFLLLIITSCGAIKSELNYVVLCAEPGTVVEVSRYGKYKINNKKATKEEALSICKQIK